MTGIYADSQTAGSDGLTNLPAVSDVAFLRVVIKEEIRLEGTFQSK